MDTALELSSDLLQIRTPAVNFHVLRANNGLYLINAGFISGRKYLQRALVDRGWEKLPIIGILVTHGHLDHILNTHSAPARRAF
jgi:glyoxylase-like metal-dependent hydrolase (beta-lactamase superfamily II)